MTIDPEHLQTAHRQALTLVEQLHSLAAQATQEQQPLWGAYVATVQDVAHFLESGGAEPPANRHRLPMTVKQQREFGRLLRDKRNAAGWSRVQLAHKAQLSDASIKFIETARHPPSRASLIRLLNVAELQLRWVDVPGQPCPPRTATREERNGLPELSGSACGPVFLVHHRLDFDELGDPVFVRRARVEGRPPLRAVDRDLETRPERSEEGPRLPDLPAEIEYVPLRR